MERSISLLERIEVLDTFDVCMLLNVTEVVNPTYLERERLVFELCNKINDEVIDEIELLIIESGN